jgi:hypothetical protein
VNDDGWEDVLVSAPLADGSMGRVHAALGPDHADFLVLADKVAEPPAELGCGMHLADIDDDRLELLVGSELATSSGVLGAGHVTVFDCDP